MSAREHGRARRPGPARRDAPGRPSPGRPRRRPPRPAASPRTSRWTRRSCSTPPDGSRSTSCAGWRSCRSRSGCGTGGAARSRWPRTPTTPPWTRRPVRAARRVRQGPRSRRGRGAGRGDGAHAPHRRRAGGHGGAPDRRRRTPGDRRRRGHAVRLGPLGPRLHAAAARRLDARRARLRRQLRLRPPAHGRHRHAADDPERRADQLHRGHVLCPRVGHGEDAALGARRPGARGWSRSRSPRAR